MTNIKKIAKINNKYIFMYLRTYNRYLSEKTEYLKNELKTLTEEIIKNTLNNKNTNKYKYYFIDKNFYLWGMNNNFIKKYLK